MKKLPTWNLLGGGQTYHFRYPEGLWVLAVAVVERGLLQSQGSFKGSSLSGVQSTAQRGSGQQHNQQGLHPETIRDKFQPS
ncbi:hypothetical protein C1H46_040250 [Malus baccata]|uniref:Uncharacterized protein n=1 Tax=Malus baccata TaxID=106549 RepID=A0A540KIY6_MALBA|nr:hypothetical protein C1H46_040250 [Malus baccata]